MSQTITALSEQEKRILRILCRAEATDATTIMREIPTISKRGLDSHIRNIRAKLLKLGLGAEDLATRTGVGYSISSRARSTLTPVLKE